MDLTHYIAQCGFQILDTLYQGQHSTIFRAVRQSDATPVIIKMLNSEFPSPQELARFRQEYSLTRHLAVDGVITPVSVESHNNHTMIVFHDIGGEAIARQLSEPLTLQTFLELAIQISTILDKVHGNRIIHKDINPSNIIWNRESNKVELIDFGISSELSLETQTPHPPQLQEGTLAYISPEQTGRMNRPVDYRTDLYSLGVTLYKILTGRLPFDTDDPMELVHSHIARVAESPKQLMPALPQVVSDIIMKLLSKMAEERYQSASSVAADLQTCLSQLKQHQTIADFEIGKKNPTGQFQLPQKLYGREDEINTLMNAFSRVAAGGSEMVMVAGYSGVGKSSLIKEIYKPVLQKCGYFISGKFEQFQHEIPYYPVIQAVQKLVHYLLAEDEATLQNIRSNLEAALNGEGQVLLDVIPELEHITGPQPVVLNLTGTEAKKRFINVFRRFFQVLCAIDHPLVLFLDDLQWADPASLTLIKSLANNPNNSYLLLLGAYRDNEVSPSHPLMLTLEEIRLSDNISPATLTLEPLKPSDTLKLLGDTLSTEPGDNMTHELAGLLQEKTGGNPFFLTRLMTSLYEKQLLTYNDEKHCWQWDVKTLRGMGISENVADLMVNKINTLSDKTQQILVLAACLGNRFNLATLATISQYPASDIAQWLWPAVIEQLIIPESDACNIARWTKSNDERLDCAAISYRFYHDRIQEAAYSRLSSQRKTEIHLKTGRLLLQQAGKSERHTRIFEIVNHLNLSQALITDPSELAQLAKLNLEAGKRAKHSTAYSAALLYYSQGMQLLRDNGWADHYTTQFALCKQQIECEFLCGNLEKANTIFSDAIQHTRNRRDTGQLYELMIRICHINYDYARGIELGQKALQLFAFSIPDNADAYQQATEEMLTAIGSKTASRAEILALINAPAMQDKDIITCCGILHETWVCLFMSANDKVLLPALTMIKLSIEYGQSAVTAVGHIFYAIVLSSNQEYERAYDFGQLAMGLKDKYFDPLLAPKVHNTFCNFVNHYKNHIRSNIPLYQESYNYCVQSGEIWWGSWAASFIRTARFIKGDPLDQVLATADTYDNYIRAAEFEPLVQVMDAQVAKLSHLMDMSGTRTSLDSDTFNESACVDSMAAMPFGLGLFWHYVYKSFLFLLYREHGLALEATLKAEEYKHHIAGLMMYPDHFFFNSLILAANWDNFTTVEKEKYSKIMQRNLEQMRTWESHCPENFTHRFLLMQAEMARINGEHTSAMDCYEQAIDAAKQNDFHHHQALANELAGLYYLSRGHKRAAQGYLLEARHGYQHWGAKRKVRYFDQQLPELALTAEALWTRQTIATTSHSEVLDFNSVMKASQAISGEIVLDKLLNKLMAILMENAGAEKGLLLLDDGAELHLKVQSSLLAENNIVPLSGPLSQITTDGVLPHAIFNYAIRTGKNVVLSNASMDTQFSHDTYIAKVAPKSVLCTPLLNQGKVEGLVYLENNLTTDAFTADRLEFINLLSAQAAISIKNAALYNTLEQKVTERTAALEAEVNERIRAEQALRDLNQELEQLASQDGLTQIANRRYFDDYLSSEWHRMLREGRPISLIFCDIDYFKEYNDAYGHQAGDDCLKLIARTMAETLKRPADLTARYGGEEFVLVLPNTDQQGLVHIAETVNNKIKALNIEHNKSKVSRYLTISMGGVTLIPTANLDVKELIYRADKALYRAKQRGRNRLELNQSGPDQMETEIR